jgi:two-component system, OmpR family, KDP operon response regulator KdpE
MTTLEQAGSSGRLSDLESGAALRAAVAWKERYSGARAKTGNRPRVLACDGEPQSLRALQVVLYDAGFEVETTSTGREALDHAAVRAPDAAIIELVLPDTDGVELCRALREWSTMPLIFLSSVCAERHKVRALQAGADDYVTKPFGPLELAARLHATMRRASPIADEPIFELDDLEINLAARVVRRRGHEIHLTPIEFKLLRVLLQHRGRVLTHNALLRAVWGSAYDGDRPTLRAHMANLRRKLKLDEEVSRIGTLHGVGYRLNELGSRGGEPEYLRAA